MIENDATINQKDWEILLELFSANGRLGGVLNAADRLTSLRLNFGDVVPDATGEECAQANQVHIH